jgi:hypothetical protein
VAVAAAAATTLAVALEVDTHRIAGDQWRVPTVPEELVMVVRIVLD